MERVESMGRTMSHRGPDNFGTVRTEHFAAAHNRLSLIDLSSAANQPFCSDEHILVYNGEIYNFRSIRERLEREKGLLFETSSDTEVLFKSLIHDGVAECLRQIRGMFAFAFYDRVRRELWIARDRLGIKPLYFAEKGGKFYFSSEMKALASALGIGPDPIRTLFSVTGIAERSSEYSVFKGIYPVKPGTFHKVVSGSSAGVVESYYDPVDEFDRNYRGDLSRSSHAEIAGEFERLFESSVEAMLVSDAPLGTFVSGGIDSSLISAVARKYYPDLKLFSANVVGPGSEIEDARRLAGHIDAELFEYRFEPEMLLRDWAEVTYFYECPIVVHANAIPFANVAKLAREKNVKAVLTGEGADELFIGYPRLLAGRYERLAAAPVNAMMALYGFIPRVKDFLFPRAARNSTTFVRELVQGFEMDRHGDRIALKMNGIGGRHSGEEMHTLRMLRDHLATLLHRNDRMGMMASIEARFPFLDENLVRFAINLPVKFKIGRTYRPHNYKHPFLVDKWVVRKMAEKLLPAPIVKKKKKGFPMTGLKSVRFEPGFFRDGWVSENLDLHGESISYMLSTQDPYFVGKLASVEVFGRIFGNGDSIEAVGEHVLANARIKE